MIDKRYLDWISDNFPTPESAHCKCREATEEMVEVFPELVRVRGFAVVWEPYGLPPTKAPHWWCETVEGVVVDPTGHQYPTEILHYEPLDESKGEPTGKCPNCGELCYQGRYTCSEKCEEEFIAYLNEA